MARTISTETKTLTITTESRTYEFVVSTPKGLPPTVLVRREVLENDQAGNVLTRKEGRTINRTLAQLLADAPAAAIVAAIPAILDRWEAEDEAAEA